MLANVAVMDGKVWTDDLLLAGGRVETVLPGGPLWRAGVRPGQEVLAFDPPATSDEWELRVQDATLRIRVEPAALRAQLAEAMPLAVAALVFAVISALGSRRRLVPAAAVSVAAVQLASVPLALSGQAAISSFALLAALLSPSLWLAVWLRAPLPLRAGVIAGAAILSVAWLAARFSVPGWYDTVEQGRQLASVGLTAAVALYLVPRRLLQRSRGLLDPLLAADVLAIAVLAALAVVLIEVIRLPLLAVAAVLLLLVVLYPRGRDVISTGLDRLFLADIRDRATVQAIEEERQRVAQELHDEPLQELAGVVRRLDERPDTVEETRILRGVADRLRRVTTDLRPPVLDDLGLGAAIAFLVDHHGSAPTAIPVDNELEDRTGLERSERLPADVEVALFRIAQEAIGNAQRHSRGSRVTVDGLLTPTQAWLQIADDGTGMSQADVRHAQRRGSLGLHSMRQRAASIDAEFQVETGDRGTRITVEWPR